MNMSSEKKNYLPDCWNNEMRMNSLMLEFRPRNVNAFGYDEKMSFWKDSLSKWNRSEKKLVFSESEACLAFERRGRTPECLKTVFDEMRKQEMLVTMEQFLSTGRSWMGWTIDTFVKRPISWSWSAVTNILNWNSYEQKFVNIVVLKEIALEVMIVHEKNTSCEWTDHIVAVEDLWQQCKNICGNKETFQLVLQHLQNEKLVEVFDVDDQKVVKFRRKDETVVPAPTEVDIQLRRMQHAKDILEKEIEKLETDMESKRNEAKIALAKGQKEVASLLLRKKKRLEMLLKKKVTAFDNLESLFNKLQESKSEKAVLQAYQSGVAAFKKIYNEGDFSLNQVDTTMADIEDVLEDQATITNALSKPIGFTSDENLTDSDLELELEEILEEEDSKQQIEKPQTQNLMEEVSKLEVHTEEPRLQTEEKTRNSKLPSQTYGTKA